ncbi:hypothetical protein PHYSODRAFT_288796 [Phytophthora sojae]|uniref:RxLR effector protein n=2 Tax=Phytophthora sojae TaxID=67593 RepID=G5A858_PHYSP|nr:hypothetical protein PHYSODRAFT_288796 [Phytophthora sojae]AEK80810.1 Avh167 [Phytophthora sojae]AEK80811.1 Avh167 [Phytophthora sojae]AEK80812.1 Avh167 [Phytophthora sojae]EGZ08084.1 hypothetical protein PHYSODRAFT_288796 [Phytophthora sojae]|eukprot:XP_009536256.1 hypothetical protein PHYSODRAFT_288796 [Phytophthora sojae]
MRLHLLVLLLAVASSTSVEYVEASADSTNLQTNNVRAGRNLRQQPTATQGDDEDRAFNTALVTEGVTNWLKASKVTWTDDQLKALVTKGTSADDALKLLQLDDGLEKLLSRKNLDTWKTFVNKLNQQNPENQVTMMSAIINKYGEEQVARMIAVAKSKVFTESVATDLQKALFQHWVREKRRDRYVWEKLGVMWKSGEKDPFWNMWWAYVNEYAKGVSKGKLLY